MVGFWTSKPVPAQAPLIAGRPPQRRLLQQLGTARGPCHRCSTGRRGAHRLADTRAAQSSFSAIAVCAASRRTTDTPPGSPGEPPPLRSPCPPRAGPDLIIVMMPTVGRSASGPVLLQPTHQGEESSVPSTSKYRRSGSEGGPTLVDSPQVLCVPVHQTNALRVDIRPGSHHPKPNQRRPCVHRRAGPAAKSGLSRRRRPVAPADLVCARGGRRQQPIPIKPRLRLVGLVDALHGIARQITDVAKH